MEVISCTCNWEIPGIRNLPAHTHTPAKVTVKLDNGRTTTIPVESAQMNRKRIVEVISEEPEGIEIWVNWKAVARALSPLCDEDEYEKILRDGAVVGRIRRIT